VFAIYEEVVSEICGNIFFAAPLAATARSGDKSRRDSFIHSPASLLASDPAFLPLFSAFLWAEKCVYGKDVHDIIKIVVTSYQSRAQNKY
jgi:hypothetical protein